MASSTRAVYDIRGPLGFDAASLSDRQHVELGYDAFSNTSASHSGWSIITSWPVLSLT